MAHRIVAGPGMVWLGAQYNGMLIAWHALPWLDMMWLVAQWSTMPCYTVMWSGM